MKIKEGYVGIIERFGVFNKVVLVGNVFLIPGLDKCVAQVSAEVIHEKSTF